MQALETAIAQEKNRANEAGERGRAGQTRGSRGGELLGLAEEGEQFRGGGVESAWTVSQGLQLPGSSCDLHIGLLP